MRDAPSTSSAASAFEPVDPVADVPRLRALTADIQAVDASSSSTTTANAAKLALLQDDQVVRTFLSTEDGDAYWKLVNSTFDDDDVESKLVCLALVAARQEHACHGIANLVKTEPANSAEKLNQMADTLRRVETFYSAIGGLLGYQLQVLELIWAQGTPEHVSQDLVKETRAGAPPTPAEADSGNQTKFHLPPGPDMAQNEAFALRAAQWGVAALPCVGEVLPLGGAGDRLGLIDERTGEPLPAAMLPYAGRCMLEHLIRDVQAREYLHYKVHGTQHVTPIAIMTSDAKGNHSRISRLIEDKAFFGRPKSSFRLVKQPSVPLVCGTDGRWIVDGSAFQLQLKPGGHGALWKLLQDEGVLTWLEAQNRHAVVVRQVSNPIAGTDTTLLSLAGYGARHGKSFGFASCPRAVGANEGMNVLVEKKAPGGYTYGVSNVEYTEFDKYGLEDDSRDDGSVDESGRAVSIFPANTNVLYVAIPAVRDVLSREGVASLPGMIINLNKKAKWTDAASGEEREEFAGRLECTMQNLADGLCDPATKPLVGDDGVVALDVRLDLPRNEGDGDAVEDPGAENAYKKEAAAAAAPAIKSIDPKEGLRRLDQLSTFVMYNERRKVTSSAKKARDPNSTRLAQTPDGSFCDLQRNAAELLTKCGMKVPPARDHEEYLEKGGPAMTFLFHPSLGPMWDVIRQKIRGGSMTTGSELVLELAEAQLVNVNINGSLLVSCDNVMGNMEAKAGEGEGKGLVFDTSQCGRVRMRHVRVENAGVNHEETVMESGDCWKHRPSRVESCRIVLHGNAEFEARRCTLSGNLSFEVPAGNKMFVTADADGKLVRTLEPLSAGGKASWGWEYQLCRDGRLRLRLRLWPGAIRRASNAVRSAVGGVAGRIATAGNGKGAQQQAS